MDYTPYLQKAFRTTVHDILTDVAQNGLQQNCAYYLTFETNRPDVVLPEFVRVKYPEEITLVFENQFENLIVTDTDIQADVSFGGVLSTVCIPFIALKAFADPNHQFGLALIPEKAAEKQAESSAIHCAKIISIDEVRKLRKK